MRAAVNMQVPTGQCLPTSGPGSLHSAPWQPPGCRTSALLCCFQLLHRRGLEDLGHLMGTLLEAEETSVCFDDMVHVSSHGATGKVLWGRESRP